MSNTITTTELGNSVTYVPTIVNFDGVKVPIVHPVNGTRYIFSEAFYNQTKGMSVLERLLYNHTNKVPKNNDLLMLVINDYPKWTPLERFYYTPPLVNLMDVYLKTP